MIEFASELAAEKTSKGIAVLVRVGAQKNGSKPKQKINERNTVTHCLRRRSHLVHVANTLVPVPEFEVLPLCAVNVSCVRMKSCVSQK